MDKNISTERSVSSSAQSITHASNDETKWKVADLLVKGIGAAFIGGAITLAGHWLDAQQQKAAEESARVKALIEFASNQKTFDANLGMTLLQRFFDRYMRSNDLAKDPGSARDMLVLLRLIALNFQDVPINLKPLFQDLDQKLADSTTSNAVALRQELRLMAQEVARRQASRMSYVGGILSEKRQLRVGEEQSFEQDGMPFVVRLIKLQPEGAEIEVWLKGGQRHYGPFTASVFDMPIVDNVKADGDTRLSVLVSPIDQDQVSIRMVSFIADLAADRFDIKEMTREYYSKRR